MEFFVYLNKLLLKKHRYSIYYPMQCEEQRQTHCLIKSQISSLRSLSLFRIFYLEVNRKLFDFINYNEKKEKKLLDKNHGVVYTMNYFHWVRLCPRWFWNLISMKNGLCLYDRSLKITHNETFIVLLFIFFLNIPTFNGMK